MKKRRIITSIVGATALALSMSVLTGCTLQEFFTGEKIVEPEKPAKQSMTNREWLNMVNDAYGTQSSEEELIKDAKDWGIIGEDEDIDLDAPVDEHFVSTTLARAAGYVDEDATEEEIEQVIEEYGLNNGDLTDPEVVQTIIEKVQEDLVHPRFEEHREIKLADNVFDLTSKLRIKDVKVKGDIVTMPFDIADTLDKDNVFILPGEKNGDEAAYKVIAIIDNGDGTADIKCVPAKLCEVYKSVNVSGHFPVDLNDFEAADENTVRVLRKNGSAGSFSGYDKEKLMSDETDSINYSTSIGDDLIINVSVKDIVINTKIDWSADNSGATDIKRIFLSADYISDVSIEQITDDKEVKEHSTLSDIELMSLMPVEIGRVPVHICSGLTLYLDLSLTANAEGEVELRVKTGETNGFEMKGAKFRTINAVLDLADIKTDRKSWEYTTMNIAVGMDYLLDDEEFLSYEVTSGPEVNGVETVHSEWGEKKEKLVCIDVKGFLKVMMNVHFGNDIVGKTNLSPTLKLLDLDEKKSRVKWDNIHYENGKKVSVCTFEEKDDKEKTTEKSTLAKGIFSIDTTYISVHEGETSSIGVSSLPTGYTENDLKWTSLDESIVSVDQKGNITAVSHGTTGVTVTTNDGKYSANCAVIVKSSI